MTTSIAEAAQLHELSESEIQALRDDVDALSRIERRTGTPGERQSAEWVAGRLKELGASDVRFASFRTQTTWAWSHLAHYAAGITAAAIGGPIGAGLGVATLLSYEADNSGRSQWLRRLLLGRKGTTVVARIPAAHISHRTLVLVAHHDAAHTGWVWNPRFLEGGRRYAMRTGRTLPFHTMPLLAMGAAAGLLLPLRIVGASMLAVSAVLSMQAALAPTVPGASDNGTGLAALLTLARRLVTAPVADTDVILLIPGGEEASMVGMIAWMRAEGSQLNRSTTLFLGLDTLGAGEPVVADREGWSARYREQDLALADQGAARAGLPVPKRFGLGTSSDPIIAKHAGFAALSLLSQRDGTLGKFHLPDDVPEMVDWHSVACSTRLASGIISAWTGSGECEENGGKQSRRSRGVNRPILARIGTGLVGLSGLRLRWRVRLAPRSARG
jgi:hypothetical protein